MHAWPFMYAFSRLVICFKINFVKNDHFGNSIKVSNSLDLDRVRHYVGPDLGPDCLQRGSADDTSRYKS